jgi:centromeric protein E
LRRQGFREEYSDVNSTSHGDIFKSPCLKTASAFVVKRSKHSTLPDSSPPRDSSPLPDAFNNVADEDTWLKMNNGYVANLDSPQTTPTRNFQSFPLSDTTPVSYVSYFYFLKVIFFLCLSLAFFWHPYSIHYFP